MEVHNAAFSTVGQLSKHGAARGTVLIKRLPRRISKIHQVNFDGHNLSPGHVLHPEEAVLELRALLESKSNSVAFDKLIAVKFAITSSVNWICSKAKRGLLEFETASTTTVDASPSVEAPTTAKKVNETSQYIFESDFSYQRWYYQQQSKTVPGRKSNQATRPPTFSYMKRP
jgi:hypothetical protein